MRRPAAALLALAYAAFVSLGLPDTVIGVAWPSLRATFGRSQAELGLALAATIAGYSVSGALAGRLVAAVGVGGLLAGSSGLVALGLAGEALAPAWLAFLGMGTLVGLGSGAIDAALNGYAARHFPVRHLNWMHAAYSLGATAGPLAMTAVLARGAPWRAGYALLSAALGAMALAFLSTRGRWGGPAAAAGGGEPAPAPVRTRDALRRGRVWLQIGIFFVYTGLEAGAGQWCFTVLREARGLDVERAGAWTAAYWGSIAAGRIALGFVVERVGPDRLLRLATAGAVAGSAAFAASAGLAGRLGLVLLGASLAPVYPTLMARTPDRLGHDTTPHAVGFQVTAATLAAAALPGALGVLAARAGVGAIAPAVLFVALALTVLHEVLFQLTRSKAVHSSHR
ncbi:MFS transporter [Anaeromyxobacter oryzae]|uniref:MFS transporter n=1 Tax=Anaeromyxobacter oryzae TaxID=2918170 RepID=A0ABN6N0F6_9BACT|nr:MFS transporter [Anaeromyxobacter oryzae]BDG05463.1 MFS transporter [Anaeromyxobacter oryzae]